MASKKLKSVVKVIAVLAILGVGGFFAWTKFFRKDKMGGTMTLDETPLTGGDNVIYNGVKVSGWISKGTLRLQNGYFTGTGNDGRMYQYRESGWIVL